MAQKHTSKRRTAAARKGAWFVAVRGSYLPVSTAGWLTYIPFLAYLIGSLFIVRHDVLRTGTAVLVLVPNWVAAGVIMTWVAIRKS